LFGSLGGNFLAIASTLAPVSQGVREQVCQESRSGRSDPQSLAALTSGLEIENY